MAVAQAMGEGVNEGLLLPSSIPVPDTVAVAVREPRALNVGSAVPVPPRAPMDAEAEALPPPAPPVADTEEEPVGVLLPRALRVFTADTLVVRVGRGERLALLEPVPVPLPPTVPLPTPLPVG